MSHYAVAVIHKVDQYIEDMLAPYDENTEIEPYLSKTKQQIIQHGWDTRDDYIYNLKRDPAYYCDWAMDEYINATCDEDIYHAETKYDDPEHFDADGNYWSTYNPNSKWDWYSYGGRFSDMLKLKKEVIERDELEWPYGDEALLSEVDFSPNQKAYDEALKFWEIYIDKRSLKDGEVEPFTLYSEDYYKEYFGTKEYYAQRCAAWSTFAVVTPDGKWHEPGNMGWFACSDSTPDSEREYYDNYYECFIQPYLDDKEMMITIMDCHI